MSQENRDMRPEYDIRGGVRGKYLARYQQWVSITSASGALNINGVASTSQESGVMIVTRPALPLHVSAPPLRAARGRRVAIAPEVATAVADAV